VFTNKAKTVGEYLKQLPADRRTTLSAVRNVVLEHLPKGYKEAIGWGAITYAIPLADYPDTYNGQPLCVAALSAGKNYCSIHLMAAYGDTKTRKWLEDAFKKSGKKLDMGKACVRFKTADDLPLDAIGEIIAKVTPDKFIKTYEAARRK
jgi:uncharacterized protein YdhG (YjbR/CyaY superfamily)